MKTQSAQLIATLFPLVISTVQGTHAAVVVALFIPAMYTRKI